MIRKLTTISFDFWFCWLKWYTLYFVTFPWNYTITLNITVVLILLILFIEHDPIFLFLFCLKTSKGDLVQLLEKKLKLLSSKEIDSSKSDHDDKKQQQQSENESISPHKKLLSETEERAITLLVRYGVSLR